MITQRRLYLFFAGWYAIWFFVGLLFLSTGWQPLFNHWEDFLFLALAGTVLFLHLVPLLGLRCTVLAFLWVVLFSGIVEAIGATTGFPFGVYHYTEKMGPRLGGLLPLAIPFAWWVVMVPLQLIWQARVKGRGRYFVPLLVGASAMLVDVALEPIATLLRGYWVWQDGGLWYGVPEQNFLGWCLTATLISFGLLPIFSKGVATVLPQAHLLRTPMVLLVSVLFSFFAAAVFAGMWPAVVALLLSLMVTGYFAYVLSSHPSGSR